MPAPLYQDAAMDRMPKDAHRGLWYDRFFNLYSGAWMLDETTTQGGVTAKKAWITGVVGKVGDRAQIESARLRMAGLCDILKGQTRVYSADWHFATGLGNPHPVENGFLWHQTLGTPYISGAAVKGLVRAWVECWMDFGSEQERLDTLYRWFGSEHKDFRERKACRLAGYTPPSQSKDTDTQAGQYIFFDALPVEPVLLKCDVMTPHMGKWYEGGGDITDVAAQPECTPADWHDPVPVYFLVAQRPKFLFGIAPRNEASRTELGAVLEALDQALQWLGAGAKTAVGYGLMGPDTAVDEKIRTQLDGEQQRLREAAEAAMAAQALDDERARMDPLKRSISDFLRPYLKQGQSEISAVISGVKKGHWVGEERSSVIQWLVERMQAVPGQWRPQSQAKRPERDKEHQNTLLALAWLEDINRTGS